LKGWFEKLKGLTRESSIKEREKKKVISIKPKVRSSQALPKHAKPPSRFQRCPKS